mgnify:CR=1 FL=1
MKESNNQDDRLNRIEGKIDKLSDAMISLARAEERQIAFEQKQANLYDRFLKLVDRVEDTEKLTRENAHTINILNRITYVVVVALVGSIVKLFIG